MRKAGRAICDAVARDFAYEHQQFGRIDPPKFVHFMGACTRTGDKRYQGRGATYGYPDTIFHCPTGTGTSARMALMHAAGGIEEDAVFDNVSAMDNRFTGQALGGETVGAYQALATDIKARPFVLATTRLHVDFNNPLMRAFAGLGDIAG
jgi:proline racemase